MLHFTNDAHPGFTRRRRTLRKSFSYFDCAGKKIVDKTVIARIDSLAIPPAYTDVWICPSATGHLQATGRDARGRKQYRYHAAWNALRNSTKYSRLAAFGHALPHIRRAVQRHVALPRLSRQKICAAIVELLDKTHIRIGNETYARDNHSFGLTTMQRRHVATLGDNITFHFRGKSGVQHASTLHNRTLSKIIRSCEELPGHELFCYVDDANAAHDITSTHVNEYLQEISGGDYTAKDFRTWHGTVLAATLLVQTPPATTKNGTKKYITTAIKNVAASLGNTPAVCRKCYIHPAVLESYAAGENNTLAKCFRSTAPHIQTGLHIPEQHTLQFLEQLTEK